MVSIFSIAAVTLSAVRLMGGIKGRVDADDVLDVGEGGAEVFCETDGGGVVVNRVGNACCGVGLKTGDGLRRGGVMRGGTVLGNPPFASALIFIGIDADDL